MASTRDIDLDHTENRMLKSRMQKLALAAVTIASAIGLTSLGTVAASAAPTMTAIPAHAAGSRTVAPRFAIVCGGDACIQTASKGGVLANVNAWARSTTFTGHFQLVNGCGNTVANSPNETWPAGGRHYTFANIHFADCGDNWKVVAWRHNSNGTYTNLGAAVFAI
jgi:hypothetical protein